jgi:transcriptional regulator with XRE-family HTH domain
MKKFGRKKTGSKLLGKLIRDCRQKNGLSGEKLANLAGIDRTHISKIEHGVHAPDFALAVKISQILKEQKIVDVFLSELFSDIDNYYAEAKKLKAFLDERQTDFKTVYERLTKGLPL